MRFFNIICCFIVVFFAANISFSQNNSKVYADGELLVKFKKSVSAESSLRANEEIGAAVVENFSGLGWQRLKLPENLPVEKARKIYENLAEVEAVQPNYYYHLLATPNDPQYSSMYGLTKISAPAAWDLTTGSAETVVAVIDTGVKYNHEDLAANMWTNPGEINGNNVDDDGNGFVDDFYGYDFFFNDANPIDENGHGTHVAGTIGAVGNNGIGVTGINWRVRLMTIKIYDADGYGSTSSMLINAYNYVRMMKNRGVNIRVTNNSYGGCDEACGYDQATKDAIDALGNAGVLQVFAAGNENRNVEVTPFYPASYTTPSILTVAASTADDSRSGFSNYGSASIDIAAPGSGITSTHNGASGYATFSGTSMASPHVAGAASLLASLNPNLSAESLKATLLNSADILPQWNGIVKTGGRLNALRALQNQTVCSYALASSAVRVPTKGGYFSVDLSAAPNCDFSVKSNASWIKIASSDAMSGGTVNFRVSVNPTVARTGTITIAGRTFTVRQSRF